MEIVSSINELKNDKPSVVTVGVFDGLHIGHQEIMRSVVSGASALGARSVVVTFDRNPEEYARPDADVPHITTLKQKLELIAAQGIDMTVVLPVNRDLMELQAERFVTDILCERLRAARVVIGSDFVFGSGRGGNVELLQKMGRELGFDVVAVTPVAVGDIVVRSTVIRKLILDGGIETANELLGHPFVLNGKVAMGDQIGRTIGFPTANIEPPPEQIVPGGGIYTATLNLGDDKWGGVLSIGTRPTVGGSRRTIELYIIGFSGDLYGQELEVAFHHRLRDEMRFPDLEALKAQIARDVEKARSLIG